MRNFFKKSASIAALLLVLTAVISCEKDFTDIGSSIINNTKFETKTITLEVLVSNVPVESVRADGLEITGGLQGEYLLGVHINDDYENIEASIVSQLLINTTSELVSYENPDNLQVITTIDTAFIRLPYQATLLSDNDKPEFQLDSIVGDQTLPFTLNVYEIGRYLSNLNPVDPSKTNKYLSNVDYQKKGSELNEIVDMDFFPTTKDTLMIIKRKSSDGSLFSTDTIRYTNASNTALPLPMAIIPLKKSFVKDVFLNNFGGANFASQDAFNDYFRGIIIESKEKTHATGKRGGSLISFNLANASTQLDPDIQVYYTNTFLKNNSTEIDTVITRSNSFQLNGIVNNKFKMTDRVYPTNSEVKLQGTAGSEVKVQILNGTELADLRLKNWLINDASLTFYINQSADKSIIPKRLHLYKYGSSTSLSQVKDKYSESSTFGGYLDTIDKKDAYTFKITDYISDLLSGESTYNPELRLKVYNTTDEAVSDTILRNYSWKPRAVTILNHDNAANGTRRAQLKISYSEKKN